MSESYDLIVIGGGSGGIAAARRAAEYGARVVLFEAARLGGTCVNVGCVPKKVMWNAAQVGDAIALAGDYGFDVAARGFDWHKLKCARDDYVARLNEIYATNLHASKVKCITATAKFCASDSVEADGKIYRAPHLLIASGGRPTVPKIRGAELGITSDGFFAFTGATEAPAHHRRRLHRHRTRRRAARFGQFGDHVATQKSPAARLRFRARRCGDVADARRRRGHSVRCFMRQKFSAMMTEVWVIAG